MISSVSITLIFITIICILAMVVYGFYKNNQKLKSTNAELQDKINSLNTNVAYLVKHSQELASIQRSQTEIRNKIEEAKDDEEISDIVSAIIAANNNRVQNNKTE